MSSIKKASLEDASAIDQLVNGAYRGDSSRKGWTTEADLLDGTRTDVNAIKELIQKENTIVLKYEDDNQIIGCVELRKEGDQLYLGMLSVKPDIQGKGIGKKLLAASEEEARKMKCTSVFMTVITARKELIDWYVRHGYSDTGHRKPFAFTDSRFGVAKTKLEFMVLEKIIS